MVNCRVCRRRSCLVGVPPLSPLRQAPVTAECLIICTVLFVVCALRTIDMRQWEDAPRMRGVLQPLRLPPIAEPLKLADAQREWGAAVTLQVSTVRNGRREVPHPELKGPFDVWDGAWWRIPVNAFHHINVLHLLINCLSAWSLGSLLERRWGSLRFALFLLPSVFLPTLSEFVIGTVCIGFSGAICAMLGALIALKQFEDDNILPEQTVQFSLAFLVLCVWATLLDVIQIANVAHFVGLAYGWCATWVMSGPIRPSTSLLRVLFVCAHIGLVPAAWYAVHPIANGRYHWYQADRPGNPLTRTSSLRRAVQCDPSLTDVWLRLADQELMEGDLFSAWQTLVEGLARNPTQSKLLKASRRLWRRMPPGLERMEAEFELERVFGPRGKDWLVQIKETAVAGVPSQADDWDDLPTPKAETPHWPLDQKIDLQWQPRIPEARSAPPVDPETPGSAAEGTSL